MDYVPDQPDQDRAPDHERQPDHELAAADERAIAALLSAVQAPAPAALHARIAALAAHPRRRARMRTPALALSGALVAAAVVLAIVLPASPTAPTALRVSQIALERANAPASRSRLAAGTTIAFPQWSARGWPSQGMRSDRLGGRTVTTEFYRSYANGTLGYAIVSGAPLRWGAGGSIVTRGGARYLLMSAAGAQVVAWVQDGHTCVLASRSAPAATLLALAVAEKRDAPL